MRFKLFVRCSVAAWCLAGAGVLGVFHARLTSHLSSTRRHGTKYRPLAARRRLLRVPLASRSWDASGTLATPPPGAFRRLFRVRATAYIPRRSEGGRYTFTERDGRAAHGIAVDPRIIPLGTRLWVPGYGDAIADDVGSAIQGASHRCSRSGRRSGNGLGVASVACVRSPRCAVKRLPIIGCPRLLCL